MKKDNRKKIGAAALRLGSILLVSASVLGGCGRKTASGNSENANTISHEDSETANGSNAETPQANPQKPDDPGSKSTQVQDGSRNGKAISESGGEAYFDSTTTVILDGEAFDIQERKDGVNAITDIRTAGSYWLVSGHIGPHNGYYGFYNTETSQWEKEIIGTLLTWYGDGDEDIPFSMDTVVYAFWNELYNIDGNLIATIELDESESEEIYRLKRTSTGVEVYIYNGAMEERMVEVEAPVSGLLQVSLSLWPERATASLPKTSGTEKSAACFSLSDMVNFL